MSINQDELKEMQNEIKEKIETKEQDLSLQNKKTLEIRKEVPPDIKADENGQLFGSSLYEQFRVANYYIKSGLLPREFDTPEKALIALQYCNSLGLKPAVAIRQICVINGKPAIYGDLPLAIVRQSGQLEKLTETIFDKEGQEICMKNKNIVNDPFACVCIAKRKGSEEIERFFTVKDAERAGLLRSNCWMKYPKDMLKYRARSQALKDLFSDVLAGAAIAEYDFGVMPEREPTRMISSDTTKENEEILNHFLKKESSADSQNADNINNK